MLNSGLLSLYSCIHHNHKPLVFEYWVLYLSNKSNKYKKYRFMRYSVEFQSPPGCLLLIFPTYKLTSSWKCTIVLYSIEMEALSLNLPVCPVRIFFSSPLNLFSFILACCWIIFMWQTISILGHFLSSLSFSPAFFVRFISFAGQTDVFISSKNELEMFFCCLCYDSILL